ncbi:MAG: spore gernimation protein GerM [Tissierellaceae bacterium]|jgi:germination protein M|nr:spore gernimation protein GerM [Tissierellaceae bacterium]
MKIKKTLLITIIFALCINLAGCSLKDGFLKLFSKEEEEIIRSDEENLLTEEDEGLRKTVLYFQNSEGLLVPLMRKIPWEEGIAKLALKNMIDSPSLRETLNPIGLTPIIPVGTEITGMSIDEETGICKVDFTENLLNCETEKSEENLVKGIVYTLTEFPAIKKVQIVVGGKILPSLKHGIGIGEPLEREDINLVEGEENARSKVVVYYKENYNQEYEYYIPVTVPTLAPTPNIYTAIEQLFEGSPSETLGLYTDIPDGLTLQGVEVRDGTAYVDVFADKLDALKEQFVIDGITKNIGLTLKQFDDIEKVELLIDGKTLEEAGIDIEHYESIPAFANEY